MRSSNRFSGPFNQQLFFETSEIDDICLEALTASRSLPETPQEIVIDRFVEKQFECECGYEELPEGVMGFTAFDKKGKVVCVRVQSTLEDGSKTGEHRVRSTWAHEAGHGLLHATLFMEVPGSPTMFPSDSNVRDNRILCRSSDIRAVSATYGGQWWEWQANRCIGGLLLPKKLVRQCLTALVDISVTTQQPSLPIAKRSAAIELISKVFNVSAAVTKIRLEEMFPLTSSQQLTF